MPANDPLGYATPELLAQLTGRPVGPRGTPISPGEQQQMQLALRQQDIFPGDKGQGAELLRRLLEVERTRQLDAARQQTGQSTDPAGWRAYNPFDILGGLLGGG